MDIRSPSFIRSLRNEASRQSEFFEHRNPELSQLWSEIETLSHAALVQRASLRLIVCEEVPKGTLIKPCE